MCGRILFVELWVAPLASFVSSFSYSIRPLLIVADTSRHVANRACSAVHGSRWMAHKGKSRRAGEPMPFPAVAMPPN
ncbi:hypothetical protein BQ8482_220126 [Mesorhizobium delmotii]|uniref:Uncharacterized protein n=1 Tax=Mesorhizobium delmotii TaxID=1631247 RepID=A0A2P9ALD0_9HYPH|nr:hypothetical protein BQ8482_220126 [Mesorhizobium delmotii]